MLDPCASIEFSRGCPWDCSFCSAWTFYGRSYRQRDPGRIGAKSWSIAEPGVFIVDDVAFFAPEHGFAIGREIERRKNPQEVLPGDPRRRAGAEPEVFRYWKRLGPEYMFLGVEAIDEEGLKAHRKRVKLSTTTSRRSRWRARSA